MQPTPPAAGLLLNALDERPQRYASAYKRCREQFSEEAVHDLRVAIRRMLALVDLLRMILPQPRLDKLRRAFKKQLNSLDALRDTQVMLSELNEAQKTLPGLDSLQKKLQKREKQLLKTARHEIEQFKTGRIFRRIAKVRAGVEENAQSGDLTANLLTALDQAYLTVTQRKGQIDPAQPSSIHQTRIAFKKFRYMVEIIHPLLPGFPEILLDGMHAYQTAMGDIQDAEVLMQTLDDFSALPPVHRFYRQRHAELISAYLARAGELAGFWRENPQKAFPWEMQP